MGQNPKKHILAKSNVIRFDYLSSIIVKLIKEYGTEKQELRTEINKLKRQYPPMERIDGIGRQIFEYQQRISELHSSQKSLVRLSKVLETFQTMPNNTFTLEELFDANAQSEFNKLEIDFIKLSNQ